MDHNIQEIIDKPYLQEKLRNYTFITHDIFNDIPLGCYIKYINLNEELKSGGFLIKKVNNKNITKRYLIIKSNIIYKLYMVSNWIFYSVIKKKTKRDHFINLLNTLNISDD